MRRYKFVVAMIMALFVLRCSSGEKKEVQWVLVQGEKVSPIQPYSQNQNYWQYKGKPILLLGASEVDNLFQLAGDVEHLRNHLDDLKAYGVNYVRCTMSSRSYPQGHAEDWNKISWIELPYPFKRLADGKYDLDQWNDEYWNRLQLFLQETFNRDIIVHVDVWDAWNLDMGDTPEQRWNVQPWNPDNNVNYTYENTCLKRKFKFFQNPFFAAVPEMENDTLLLRYQKKFVEKIVDAGMAFPHVIFQIDNESPLDFRISHFWARFIRDRAEKKFHRTAYVSESRRFRYPALKSKPDHYPYPNFQDWNNPEIRIPITARYDDDFLFNCLDISQNNGNFGELQYRNILWYKAKVAEYKVRPITNIKAYWWNWPTGQSKVIDRNISYKEKVGKMWRPLFAGVSSIRYHRIWSRQKHWQGPVIKSARMLTDAMTIFAMRPENDLLSQRGEDEAYCLAEPGKQYAIYFTGLGDNNVLLDISSATGDFVMRWLNISDSIWGQEKVLRGGQIISLIAPDAAPWAVLLKKTD